MHKRRLESNENKNKKNSGSITTSIQHLSRFSTFSCPTMHHNKLCVYTVLSKDGFYSKITLVNAL